MFLHSCFVQRFDFARFLFVLKRYPSDAEFAGSGSMTETHLYLSERVLRASDEVLSKVIRAEGARSAKHSTVQAENRFTGWS